MIRKVRILFYCLLLINSVNLFSVTPINSGKYSLSFGSYQAGTLTNGDYISFHKGIDIVPDSNSGTDVVSPVDGWIVDVEKAQEDTSTTSPSAFDITIYENPYSEPEPWAHVIAHVKTNTSSSFPLTLEYLFSHFAQINPSPISVPAGLVIAKVGTVHPHEHIHYTTKHADYNDNSLTVYQNPLSIPSFNGITDPGNNAPEFGKLFVTSGYYDDSFLHGTEESEVDTVHNNVYFVREIWDNMNFSGQLESDGGIIYPLTVIDDKAYLSNGNGFDDIGDEERFNGRRSAPYKIEFQIKDRSDVMVWPTQTVVFDTKISASKFDGLLNKHITCPHGQSTSVVYSYAYNLTAIDDSTRVETVTDNSNEVVARYWATKLKIPDLSNWTNSLSDFSNILDNWYGQAEAEINEQAVYKDGEYTVTTKAYDFANNSSENVVSVKVDNFMPYLKRLKITNTSDSPEMLYDAGWEWSVAIWTLLITR